MGARFSTKEQEMQKDRPNLVLMDESMVRRVSSRLDRIQMFEEVLFLSIMLYLGWAIGTVLA